MITVATMVRDTPHIDSLIGIIDENMPCEYELAIGDNSTNEDYSYTMKQLADVYVRIEDKQLFRMGLPWAHNLINSHANTYKIFYVDSDEYPVWINPGIEEALDLNYIIPALRYDFFTREEINEIDSKKQSYEEIKDYCESFLQTEKEGESRSIQDRIYNSRYVQFNGLCHSIFHAPPHFRAAQAGAIYLHNKTIRNAKDKDRMDKLIDEQFMRENINFMLASSENVLKWGKHVKEHQFEDWNEWTEAYNNEM